MQHQHELSNDDHFYFVNSLMTKYNNYKTYLIGRSHCVFDVI